MQDAKNSPITAGIWVICLDLEYKPSSWGYVLWCLGDVAGVRYGKEAPIWMSNTWEIKYLLPTSNEELAQKAVKDHNAKTIR